MKQFGALTASMSKTNVQDVYRMTMWTGQHTISSILRKICLFQASPELPKTLEFQN